jgi:hypothetical protein
MAQIRAQSADALNWFAAQYGASAAGPTRRGSGDGQKTDAQFGWSYVLFAIAVAVDEGAIKESLDELRSKDGLDPVRLGFLPVGRAVLKTRDWSRMHADAVRMPSMEAVPRAPGVMK